LIPRAHITAWRTLTSHEIDDRKVVTCFGRYLDHDGLAVSRAEFEENLSGKLRNQSFLGDITPLLPAGVTYNIADAGELVGQRLIAKLQGDPWKGSDS